MIFFMIESIKWKTYFLHGSCKEGGAPIGISRPKDRPGKLLNGEAYRPNGETPLPTMLKKIVY